MDEEKKVDSAEEIVDDSSSVSSKGLGKKDYLVRMRENPWIVSTIVLGLVLVGVLLFGFKGGVTGNVVSSADAGQNLVDFISSRGTDNVEVLSVEREDSLYLAKVSVEGQVVPVYVTLDGKYAITSPIPLTTTNADNSKSDSQPPQTNVPKSDKPKVELFVMSYCPYGTQIEKGIIPVLKTLKDKIDFELKFVNYAMHPSQGEVEENTRQYCIQKEQSDKFLDYLECFLGDGDSDKCLTEAKINKAKLDACYSKTDKEFDITKNLEDRSSWTSGRFPQFLINDEDNKKYGVRGSPTLIINGVQASSGRDSNALLSTICSAFNDAPEECDTEFESGTPSPGFGWDTTSSNNLAQCG